MFEMETWVKHHEEVEMDTTIEIPRRRSSSPR